MAQPQVREPETTWGFIRALIQAGTGVAFVLEEMPRIGAFLFVVAACTVVYEAAQWRRVRRRRAIPGGPGVVPPLAVRAGTGAFSPARPATRSQPATAATRPGPATRPCRPETSARRPARPRVSRGARAARWSPR